MVREKVNKYTMKQTLKVLTIIASVTGAISAILTGIISLLKAINPDDETPSKT